MSTTPAQTLAKVDTVFTADSVEWYPVHSAGQLLALGTYQLQEESRKRVGSLTLFSFIDYEPCLKQVAKDKTVPLKDGILDMKWYVGCALDGLK